MTPEQRYLHLLKMVLTRAIVPESYDKIPRNSKTVLRSLRWNAYDLVNRLLAPTRMVLVDSGRPTGETMLDMARLDNIEQCVVDVLRAKTPGDLVETGVWRGGATIFMKAILEVYGESQRNVWVADSFEGLPKPDPERYPADAGDQLWKRTLDVSLGQVRANFERYGLLDERVKFLKGFFSDTMPSAPIHDIAVLRLDGDMYESTYVVLEHLYPKVSRGGYVIVDDYGCIPSCAQATEDYRRTHRISEPISKIDWTGVYWQKK